MKRIMMTCAALLLSALPVFAANVGDDGLHKAEWMRDTFKDLREDLAEANAEGKRLALIIEQRGCIYCQKMHEEVFPIPAIDAYIKENYFFIQINMFGDIEVTDFDGETLPEKEMVRKWGLMFTPTMMFFGLEADEAAAPQVAVAQVPGAFGKHTTLNLLTWVKERGYESDEPFQKYHARKLAETGSQ